MSVWGFFSMKIQSQSSVSKVAKKIKTTGKTSGDHKAEQSEQFVNSEKITLSPYASLSSAIEEEIQQIPEIRMERVANVRNEIVSGHYSPPSEQVARKMIVSSLFESLYR